jgi:hypothetical protein
LLSLLHAVPLAVKPSAGQLADVPEHLSAGSHSPAEARQVVALVLKMSAGQVADVPVHFSSASQTPFAPRHVTPLLPAGC